MNQTFKTLAKRVPKHSRPENCEIVDAHCDPEWVALWSHTFWADDVNLALSKAHQWTVEVAESDKPGRLPTKRSLRQFLGNWIRRDCRLRPQVRMVAAPEEPRPEVAKSIRDDAIKKMKEALSGN